MNKEIFVKLCKYNTHFFQWLEPFIKIGGKFCNVNRISKDYNDETTMMMAAKSSNLQMMQLLSKYGFDWELLINNETKGDFERQHPSTTTIFLASCFYASVKCLDFVCKTCQTIVGCTINVYVKDKHYGRNGLHWAIIKQNVEIVKYLLNNVYKGDDKFKLINDSDSISNLYTITLCMCNKSK